jgi:hypothetical protein
MNEAVECLASASYPGDPVALTLQGQRREVEAILSRWRGPDGPGFRVRARSPEPSGGPGQVFDLIYDSGADTWRIVPV